MKIRKGFVSNSSSSSYILYIPPQFKVNHLPGLEDLLKSFMTDKNFEKRFKTIDVLRDRVDQIFEWMKIELWMENKDVCNFEDSQIVEELYLMLPEIMKGGSIDIGSNMGAEYCNNYSEELINNLIKLRDLKPGDKL